MPEGRRSLMQNGNSAGARGLQTWFRNRVGNSPTWY